MQKRLEQDREIVIATVQSHAKHDWVVSAYSAPPLCAMRFKIFLSPIHNIDSSNSNIAFDSSNKISNYQPILGTGGIRPPAALVVQIGARMLAPAS